MNRNSDKNGATHSIRLALRRRHFGRRGRQQGVARQQGREPRRNGFDRPAVPPGFTISTEMCARRYVEGEDFTDSS